jgi:cysteine desulfurase
MTARHYFDHNATTPLCAEAKAAMTEAMDNFGNPSSLHEEGQRARGLVDKARAAVAKSVGARRDEIHFTSGGTEADNWALLSGASLRNDAPRRVLISSIEHPAALAAGQELARRGFAVEMFGVTAEGVADLAELAAKLKGGAALVALMLANNETGVIQPAREAAALAHAAGALFFTDAVQAWGKIPLNAPALDCDLMALSAHKLYGPKGCGALFIRKGLDLPPFHLGGGQEMRRRGGTEASVLIAGQGAAAARVPALLELQPRLAQLRDRLEQRLRERIADAVINGAGAERTAGTTSMSFAGVEGEALLINCDLEGFALSTGAACSSGQLMPSHVLVAMGLPAAAVRGSLRVSLGESSTQEGVDQLADALAKIVPTLRRLHAAG